MNVSFGLRFDGFLLTPLREGRPGAAECAAGGLLFLLTPLREGRPIDASRILQIHVDFYSRPCGRGDMSDNANKMGSDIFLLTPLREGRPCRVCGWACLRRISTHAPAGGATFFGLMPACFAMNFYSRPCGRGDLSTGAAFPHRSQFLLTPLREGRREYPPPTRRIAFYFYSRPCGRGDVYKPYKECRIDISTHAPAGGATAQAPPKRSATENFYSRPCGRGDGIGREIAGTVYHFYSRPCGRGDDTAAAEHEGLVDFYSRPCGRGDKSSLIFMALPQHHFYSRPCGRGDPTGGEVRNVSRNFYSRPCGRGDACRSGAASRSPHFYSRPCGRGDRSVW